MTSLVLSMTSLATLVACFLAVAMAAPSPDLSDTDSRLTDALSSLLPNLVEESPSRCLQPVKVGTCRAAIRRWAFDRNTHNCRPFPWSGCGGSANMFRSESECKSTCGSLLKREFVCPSRDSCPTRCSFRFNSNTGCQQCVCKDELEYTPSVECTLPAETGVCKGAFERWAFTSGECRKFLWGGCGGNSNNFLTLTQCLQACAPTST